MHIFDKIGVRPLINAAGTYTELGGTLMPPEVLEAMSQAAARYVDLEELQIKSGEYLAGLIGVEAAFITSGAAAGLLLCTAACIAGDDPARMAQLPDTTGLPCEVVIHRSHYNDYLQTVRLTGARLVEIGSPRRGTRAWELEAALTPRTAAVMYFAVHEQAVDLALSEVIRLAHQHGVPVIVDAAAELPPADNLRFFCDMGADLVVFSGGKALRGPQSTGLILGRADLIRACRLQSSPQERLGRALKVSKEDIAGLVAAVERFLALDPAAEQADWEKVLVYIKNRLTGIPGLSFDIFRPKHAGAAIPRLAIEIDPAVVGLTRAEVVERLLHDDPVIHLGLPGDRPNALAVHPLVLRPEDVEVLVERLRAVLTISS